MKLNCLPSRSAWDPAWGPDVAPHPEEEERKEEAGENKAVVFSFPFVHCGFFLSDFYDVVD